MIIALIAEAWGSRIEVNHDALAVHAFIVAKLAGSGFIFTVGLRVSQEFDAKQSTGLIRSVCFLTEAANDEHIGLSCASDAFASATASNAHA